MKKSVYVLITAFTVSSVLAACGTLKETTTEKGKNTTEGEQAGVNSGKLKVMTSFYPMYDFAQKVGGDKVEVTNMVPAGTEPHDWEPAATDIKQLEEADVFVYNGAGMEHWTEDMLDSLDNKNLTVVEASEGLELMEGETHGEEAEDTSYDPHVWLNPMNAKIEMENIKNALADTDPENKEYYTKNYQKYAVEFDTLDKAFKEGLADTKRKEVITAHEALGYLCKAYGLNQVGIEGLSPDSEPDPARMDEIIQFAKEHKVKTIFFEELVSPKVAETIADEIGAKTEVLNPLEGLSDEQLESGEDYFSVMETNLEALKGALNQ
ncbi:metal ABC transporter substrate-binding protein [Clostridium sp. C105KSO13]|uniref:metal ABC transporter substrate-binding protein n=1 Tax=Clostridium sp. C105KSO13 TaxID=1776045 RepID=UPI0007408413|nr:High-affinity zinc uptake system binding-protein ZnuA precursor [Clostridium sp. C105KSO13]